jgi:adenylate cyclase
LEGKSRPRRKVFRGKTVLIGAIASDLQDLQDTPLGHLPGVQIHAHALTALLGNSFIHPMPETWRWGSLLAAAVMAWMVVHFMRQPVWCVGVLDRDLPARPGAFPLAGLTSPASEAAAQPFLLGIGRLWWQRPHRRVGAATREKSKLRHFLARYTSPELVREMMADHEGLYTTLGGVERRVTMFFSDIRGFTSISEKLSPSEVVKLLNEYLTGMVACVFQHRGLVDKFIGDAVMALWGSTRAQPERGRLPPRCHRRRRNGAAHAAGARRAKHRLAGSWDDRTAHRHGHSPGNVVVGNIGSAGLYEKMDLTVIGDSVNLASRLEGVTKQYEIDLLISETVHPHVKDLFLCRRVDLIAVKGKAKPIEIFTVLGPADMPVPPGLLPYDDGMTFTTATDASPRPRPLSSRP